MYREKWSVEIWCKTKKTKNLLCYKERKDKDRCVHSYVQEHYR